MREKAVLYIVDGRKTDISKAPSKKYKVQYNPTEITINAGEPRGKSKKNKLYKTGTSREHKTAEYKTEQYSIRVTVPLKFDNSPEYEKYISAGAPINETQLSVQTETEAFIAMIRNPNIRYLIFSWGAICYEGELSSMSGQYTMFTKSGIPIRAELSLTIKCKDINDGRQWFGMYSKAFSGGIKNKFNTSNNSINGLNKALLKIAKVKYDASSKTVTADKNSVYTMEVMYNPASISISSGASLDFGEESAEGKNASETNGTLEISFQLIFDSTDTNDTGVADITNGLLSLMTDKAMTRLEFCWGDMSFKGQLSGAQAKFTMFSEEGIPKRAVVDISLGREETDKDRMDKAFDKLMEKKYGSL